MKLDHSARHKSVRRKPRGFTLIEMLITLLVLGIVVGGLLSQMDLAVQRQVTERIKLDDMQEARDFIDQFFRDINEIGYPNIRMFDNSTNWLTNPVINDSRVAVGLVKIDANEIRFEADTSGDGSVQSVIYKVNGSGNCTLCLQRSQVSKVNGVAPLNQAVNWGTEINDVVDVVNAQPIFTYYDKNANQLPVPADIVSNPNEIASVKVIKISLTIRNPAVRDPRTGVPIENNFQGEVSLNNCSMAAPYNATLSPMGCK